VTAENILFLKVDILRVIGANPGITIDELAGHFGVELDVARNKTSWLRRQGLIQRTNVGQNNAQFALVGVDVVVRNLKPSSLGRDRDTHLSTSQAAIQNAPKSIFDYARRTI
jgi:hypothetical protein